MIHSYRNSQVLAVARVQFSFESQDCIVLVLVADDELVVLRFILHRPSELVAVGILENRVAKLQFHK